MLKFKEVTRHRVYFDTDETIKDNYYDESLKFVLTHEDGEYKLFTKETSMKDLFTYGAIQLKDGYSQWDHKAGYVWASRVGCLNKQFGTQFIEVNVGSRGYAMDVNLVKKLVEEQTGDKYSIVEDICFDDKEPYYNLVKEEK